jgi:hypothetical protein
MGSQTLCFRALLQAEDERAYGKRLSGRGLRALMLLLYASPPPTARHCCKEREI